jgi:hypothetical protein
MHADIDIRWKPFIYDISAEEHLVLPALYEAISKFNIVRMDYANTRISEMEFRTVKSLKDIPGFLQPEYYIVSGSQAVLIYPYSVLGDMIVYKWNSESYCAMKACLMQLAASLLQAHEQRGFLHADTNTSDILIFNTDEKEVDYTLNGHTFSIPTHGFRIMITNVHPAYYDPTERRSIHRNIHDNLLGFILKLRRKLFRHDINYQSFTSVPFEYLIGLSHLDVYRKISSSIQNMSIKSYSKDILDFIERAIAFNPSHTAATRAPSPRGSH